MGENSGPLVSFVVPCYNYARYLPDCVNSILAQDAAYDYEIILIDDASTDETPSVIQTFTDSRIFSTRHATNLGHVKTIEEGLSMARGKYVARIDPDDRYRPDFLSLTIEKLECHPEVGAVYGDVAQINDEGAITVERSDTEHGGQDFKGNELVRLMERNFICAPSLIARREAWLAALPIPSWLAFNDWYFTLSMARNWEFYYLDSVLADYRVHGSNHHAKVVKEKTEEPSIFWLLDHIFTSKEKTAELEAVKRRARRRIYASQYLDMAEKYFSCNYNDDARRCYVSAFKNQPSMFFRTGPLRRFIGTVIGREAYELSKLGVNSSRARLVRERPR
ncbi:MAG TPA: glycosyltransferase family 2 protein [Pyrinomonadaceae bacterium]